MANKKTDLDGLVEKIAASDAGELEKDVILAEVDPADGSQATRDSLKKDDTYDGTKAEELPPAPVDALHAAQVLAQRAWEKEQGKAAEIPDPDKDKK